MVLVDTHCHLDFNLFDSDREIILERAHQDGIDFIIDPGIDLTTSKAALKLAGLHPEVYAAVGVHPGEANTWNNETIDQLTRLALDTRVVAIGEIGLDYYHEKTNIALQKEIFVSQLMLAAHLNLPVIVHSREAAEDTLEILAEWYGYLKKQNSSLIDHPGVMHSFESGIGFALKYINMNFLIGIGGPVTFKNARDKHELASEISIDNILLETDAPFLTPHPFRGKRNEPDYVKFVAEKIAELKDLSLQQVGEITTNNATELFRREFAD